MIRRLVVSLVSMTRRRKTYRVSYEEAVRYHSGKPEKYTRSPIGSWALWSLPPLILNEGEGLLCWVIIGVLVTPLVVKLFGQESLIGGAAMTMTACAFVNMFLILVFPQWFLITVYILIVVVVWSNAER